MATVVVREGTKDCATGGPGGVPKVVAVGMRVCVALLSRTFFLQAGGPAPAGKQACPPYHISR